VSESDVFACIDLIFLLSRLVRPAERLQSDDPGGPGGQDNVDQDNGCVRTDELARAYHLAPHHLAKLFLLPRRTGGLAPLR